MHRRLDQPEGFGDFMRFMQSTVICSGVREEELDVIGSI